MVAILVAALAVATLGLLAAAPVATATPGVSPVVTISSPSDGAEFPTGDVAVTWDVTGSENVVSMKCFVDTEEVMAGCDSATGHQINALSEGPHTFSIEVTDDENDTGSDAVFFTVDVSPPAINFEYAQIYTTGTGVLVPYTITDNSVDESSIECDVDGTPLDCSTDLNGTTGDRSHVVDPLTPGKHVFTISAADTLGRSTSASTDIYVQADESAGGSIDVDYELSTTRAGRHPDLTIDVNNSTNEDVLNASIAMPSGLVGSLRAVGSKCSYPPASITDPSETNDISEIDAWCDETTRTDSQIGTALVEAKVDGSTTRLKGTVHFTEAGDYGEPAGLAIVVHVKASNLDLGWIVIGSRLLVRTGESGDPSQSITAKNPYGVNSSIEGIPDSVTSVHGTTDVTVKRTTISIDGSTDRDDAGPLQPLLTNASGCVPSGEQPLYVAKFRTYDGAYAEDIDEYTVADCEDQPFGGTMDFTFTNPDTGVAPAAGEATGMSASLVMDEGSTALKRMNLALPRSIVQVTANLDTPCSIDDARQEPPACVDEDTLVGTFSIESPLLDAPVVGTINLVDSGGAIPFLLLYSDDAEDIGVKVRSFVWADPNQGEIPQILSDAPYTEFDSPTDLPDVPISRIDIDVPGLPISGGSIFQVLAPGSCRVNDTVTYRLEGHSGRADVGSDPVQFAGCTGGTTTTLTPSSLAGTTFLPGTAPDGMGETTTDTTPTFNFSHSGPTATNVRCRLDSPAGFEGEWDPVPGPDYHMSRPVEFVVPLPPRPAWCPSSGIPSVFNLPELDPGIHTLAIAVFNGTNTTPVGSTYVIFQVDDGSITQPETDAPDTTLDNGPTGSIADKTPQFDYSSNEPDSSFQCRMDDEAFQPCAGGPDDGSFTPSTPLFNGQHTFEVRAEDGVGNVDLSPASTTFTVDPPFAPTFDVTVSDTRARAHPNLTVEITSDSDKDLRDLSFSMPNGFVGSLLGAAMRCSAADAAAAVAGTGACPANSKVGTVDAEAQIDLSDVVQSGDVFLTEPLQAGDPGGIVVCIDAEVGAIDMGTICVRQRLIVRGNADGIDAASLDQLPRSVVDNKDADGFTGAEVFFHLRKAAIKLTGGAGASQPLLTNPSNCTPSAFKAAFTSYDGAPSAPPDVPFEPTPGSCDALPFYTAFAAEIEQLDATFNPTGNTPTAGDTTRFTGTIAASPDDAGVKFARLELPRSLTATTAGLPIGCSVAVYEATKTCDKGDAAVIGSVVAETPLLPAPLEGKVYLGQPKPGSFIEPGYDETLRIIAQLRGLVSIDLVGRTTLKDFRAISVFDNIPDAPVTAFRMTVDKIVRVRPTACDADLPYRTITGYNLAQNGKTSNYNSDVMIDCGDGPPSFSITLGGKGKKAKATILGRARTGTEFRSLEVQLPRGLKPVKKGIKKKLQVIADGRKLSSRCAKLRGNKLIATLCGKKAKKLEMRLNPGSLYMPKKLRRPTFKLKSSLVSGRIYSQNVQLGGRRLKGNTK